ncbi:M48 family metallopeptidase [Cereibacter sphaeroides]|uniref:M48 family metallopeptidase n=1 Tax=Cereibacter sphaeroides TaxID=1063 RepID=UPI001F2273FE|nr:M48 family metallopeptidase [Cereibacter sphaeroides]MCE6961429.1 M48 family metallopeptidase [Cereibacter sphaeroides]MCE6970416.1 M48 family metallopeptidase [Cereibacter sphaeroides]MCE6973890.1 M48 family metallopeptidase [Cereibacter sphaeroides]
MSRIGSAAILLLLAGCAAPPMEPVAGYPGAGVPVIAPAPDPGPIRNAAEAQWAFAGVVARVEPVAEGICRERTRGVPCDFQIVVDTRPGEDPNAFQTLDDQGRPVIGLTLALLADARNVDELAFVVGHETAHHILGHIPRQRETAMTGAVLAGVIAQMGRASVDTIRSVQQMGATVGARSFSKNFELEADGLGTEIAILAGYDPVHGAMFFTRLPDPGDTFLGSHPPNAQRIEVVRRAAEGFGYVSRW